MSFNYCATCHSSTAVSASLSCSFTSENDLNLIVAKTTRLEIFKASSTGLEAVIQSQIYGNIVLLEKFRPKLEKKDFIIMMTEKFALSILEFDSETMSIVTKASGQINDKIGKTTLAKSVMCINQESTYALIRIYDGILKLISLDLNRNPGIIRSHSIRINELLVIDIAFLTPTHPKHLHIGLIYKDRNSRNFRSYNLRPKDMQLRDGSFRLPKVEDDVLLILPLSRGGAIFLGRKLVTYLSQDGVITVSPPAFKSDCLIISATQISKKEYPVFLLGDTGGNLYKLSIQSQPVATYLGQTCYPSSLTYLDNGVVFVGSMASDSQLIRINNEIIDGSCITVLDSYLNIGPIVDMEIADLHSQGIPQLITCSGINRWGSLRILTNGVVVREEFSFSFKYVKSIWPLKTSYIPGTESDDSILVSFFDRSLLLREENENLTTSSCDCFIKNENTIYAGNAIHSQIIQVTPTKISLINCQSMRVVWNWSHPDKNYICLCSCDGYRLVVTVGNEIFFFVIKANRMDMTKSLKASNQVSAINIFNLGPLFKNPNLDYILAISYWENNRVEIRSFDGFELFGFDTFDHEFVFRSLLIVRFKPSFLYLLAGLGTGDLFIYELFKDSDVLSKRTKAHLGTKPLLLIPFNAQGSSLKPELIPGYNGGEDAKESDETHVICCSDQTSIIHHNNFRIVFSHTNKQITKFCAPFDGSFIKRSILIVTNSEIEVCKVSDICTYHVASVPIYETPRRIVYQEETSTFGLITVRENSKELSQLYNSLPYNQKPISLRVSCSSDYEEPPNDEKIQVSSFVVVNQTTFEPISSYSLPKIEHFSSLISCKFRGKSTPFFVLGTICVSAHTLQIESGRVLVFQLIERNLTVTAEYTFKGAVYNMAEHNGRLVLCVDNYIVLMEMRYDNDFVILSKNPNHVMAIYLKTSDDCVLVGDIIRSMSHYNFTSDQALELKGLSSDMHWLNAIEILDKEHFIASTADGKIIVSGSHEASTSSSDREPDAHLDSRLGDIRTLSSFQICEQINVFKLGSLVHRNFDDSSFKSNYNIIFGTSSGHIGVIFDLPQTWHQLLSQMEEQMLTKLSNVGEIDYYQWREKTCKSKDLSHSFIDGDLIENFLNLQQPQINEILTNIDEFSDEKMSIDKKTDMATAFVGDLARLH